MWDLSELYTNDSDWLKQKIKISNKIENFWTCSNIFTSILDISISLDKLYTYLLLKRELSVDNGLINIQIDEIHRLYEDFNTLLSKVSSDSISNIKFIDLSMSQSKDFDYIYSHIKLDKNNHIDLSRRIGSYDSFLKWYFSFESIGIINHIKINEYNLLELLNSNDKLFRFNVYITVEKFLKHNSFIASFFLNTHFQTWHLDVKSIDEVFNKIDLNDYSYDFIKKIRKNMKKLNTMMIKSKCKSMNVKKIDYSDLYYLKNETSETISFKDAEKIVIECSKIYGMNFFKLVKKVFKDNWIYFSKEKNDHYGQRSFSSYTTHPYIKISWNNNIDSLYDLIHEIYGAISQYLSSKNGSFFYSELSIIKTEFVSNLGALALNKYLKEHNNYFSSELINDKSVDFIKDSFLVPYENSYVESILFNESKIRKLNSNDISKIWNDFVSDYHKTEFFLGKIDNKYNWVRNEHFYMKGYDFNYVISFIYSVDFFLNENAKSNNLYNYLIKGEQISNNEFFERLISNKLSISFSNTLKYCENILIGRDK